MSEDLKARLLDLKARQDAGERMMCPRCGLNTMKDPIHTNALSRHADVYVCDACGTSEALLVMMNNPLPLRRWAFFTPKRPESDLGTLPFMDAMQRLQAKQIPFLVQLFDRWMDEGAGDFEAYRIRAIECCPGLIEIWERPSQATFSCLDGRILVRFKVTDTCIEVATDLIPK